MERSKIQVEMLPAGYGDSFLLRLSGGDSPSVNILVDGGLVETYNNHIRPRLSSLHSRGEQLDLVIVTHIDADHISGILSLLRENGCSDEPNVIHIGEVWHNGYIHLPLKGRDATEEEVSKVVSQVADPAPHVSHPEISVRQGENLSEMLTLGGYAWNASFGGGPVLAGETTVLQNGATITILSPDIVGLEGLAYLWQLELVKMGVDHTALVAKEFDAAFEKTALQEVTEESFGDRLISNIAALSPPAADTFREDTSATNRSSIAFLLEWCGMKCLFLGDAWPSVIRDSLSSGEAFDLLKLSHHGARGNTSPDLLSHLTARHILCSSDGSRHNHPALDSLLWVVSTQPKPLTLHFNYPTDAAVRIMAPCSRQQWGHDVAIAEGAKEVLNIVLTSNE